MSFTTDVKSEMLSVRLNETGARRAFVSAFLRTCGSIEIVSDRLGFSVVSDTEVINYFCRIVKKLYFVDCECEQITPFRSTARVINEKSAAMLVDLGVLKAEGDELTVSLNIDFSLVGDQQSFTGYLMGAFLGSGSVTAPEIENKKKSKTGYHLEFVFSKYVTADDFCNILAQYDFMPKSVERKDQFVVYFKSVEEIETIIGLMGAHNAFLKLNEVQIQKGIRNEENRKINCEMSNLTKSIDASIKQREDIKLIAELVGLDSLKPTLKDVATARLENEDMSLQQLADLLGISKSCLTHRLRKLSEIAQSLR